MITAAKTTTPMHDNTRANTPPQRRKDAEVAQRKP